MINCKYTIGSSDQDTRVSPTTILYPISQNWIERVLKALKFFNSKKTGFKKCVLVV